MKKTAFIWRESVYKNHFICKCGYKLANDKGYPGEHVLAGKVNETEYLFCPECELAVAKLTEIDAPEDMTGLQGDFGKWRGGQ